MRFATWKPRYATWKRSNGKPKPSLLQVAQEEERLDLAYRQLQDWQTTTAPRLAEVTAVLQEGRFALTARTALAALDAQCRELGYDPQGHEAARQREQALRAPAKKPCATWEKARAGLPAWNAKSPTWRHSAKSANAR